MSDLITYGAGLLALAIVLRNGEEVGKILSSVSMGARYVSSTLLVGSMPGSAVQLPVYK